MDMDALLKKANIKFERGLSLEQAEDLLVYLAKNVPAHIRYEPIPLKHLTPQEHCPNSKIEFNQTMRVKLSGSITLAGEYHANDCFEFKQSIADPRVFDSMKLSLMNLDAYRDETLTIVNSTLRGVKKYFGSSKS